MEGFLMSRLPSDRLILLCLVLCVSFLLVANLGNHYLWQDEAETALLGKSVLTYGFPRGTDGVNFFSQLLGGEYGADYVWKWHTWFPFYIVAASFKIFGETTFSARLPFALFGAATVLMVYLYVLELWENCRTALISVFLLTVSVPFLILCRQCRYYSVSAFFSVMGLYFFQRMIKGKRYAVPWYLLSFFLLFHTNYVHAACFLFSNLICCGYLVRKKPVKFLLKYLYTFMGAFVIVLPWLIWLSKTNYQKQQYGVTSLNLLNAFSNFSVFLLEVFESVVTYPVTAILTLFFVVAAIRSNNNQKVEWSTVITPLLFIVTVLAVHAISSPVPFFRYLSPVIPVIICLLAFFFERVFTFNLIAGICLLTVFVANQPLKDYYYELTHDYNGPVGGIVKFLKENARPDDTVAITYEDLPLKFYTPLRVVGGLTGEDLTPALTAEWVIVRKHVICEKDEKVRNYLIKNINPENYQPIHINSPDIPFENRESPGEHHYRTVQNEEPIVIYKKIR